MKKKKAWIVVVYDEFGIWLANFDTGEKWIIAGAT